MAIQTGAHSRRSALRLLGGAALLPATAPRAASASTASWPNRPIRVIVPWPAGGPTDTYARVVVRELAPLLGQPVVVENRAGATGTVGIQHVARGTADGHTLLVANTTAYIGSVVSLADTVQFDPLTDFTPIGLFTESASILWANPSLNLPSFEAFLARARAQKASRLAFGTTGSGSVSEQAVELLARHFKLELIKVPYRGTAPQVMDLVAGHVQIGGADFGTAAPHFRDGRLVPLLSLGQERLSELPDVPSMAEIGLTEPDFTIWNGMFAPAATPLTIVERLRTALEAALSTAAVREVTAGNGNRAIFQTGEAAQQGLERELADRRAFIRSIPVSAS
jgi:tripartite-type tricarboxylate transporter receptor subunit TctC